MVYSDSPMTEPATELDDLDKLRAAAAECIACSLYKDATQTVFGEGPSDACLMLIGETPGDQEDKAGEPFVGPAGGLLNRALREIGIDRTQAYVTNAVNTSSSCRPHAASGASTRRRHIPR